MHVYRCQSLVEYDTLSIRETIHRSSSRMSQTSLFSTSSMNLDANQVHEIRDKFDLTPDNDLPRLLSYFKKYSTTENNIKRYLRLPPTTIKEQRRLLYPRMKWFLPKGSIRLGHKYLTPDGSRIELYFAFSWEHALILTMLICFLVATGTLWYSCSSEEKTLDQQFYCSSSITFGIIACFLITGTVTTLSVDFDPRNFHDPILLPLTAASFCSNIEYGDGSIELKHEIEQHTSVMFLWENFTVTKPIEHYQKEVLEKLTGVGDVKLSDCVKTMSKFIAKDIGLKSGDEEIVLDNGNLFSTLFDQKSALFVIFILNERTAIAFLKWMESNSDFHISSFIIVSFFRLVNVKYCSNHASIESCECKHKKSRLGDYCVVLLLDPLSEPKIDDKGILKVNQKTFIEDSTPYDGLAQAIFDHIGCKIGSKIASEGSEMGTSFVAPVLHRGPSRISIGSSE